MNQQQGQGQARTGAGSPRQASVNEGIDLLVDTTQSFKNFLNGMFDNVVDTGQDVKNEVNTLIDSLIDRLQKAKG